MDETEITEKVWCADQACEIRKGVTQNRTPVLHARARARVCVCVCVCARVFCQVQLGLPLILKPCSYFLFAFTLS